MANNNDALRYDVLVSKAPYLELEAKAGWSIFTARVSAYIVDTTTARLTGLMAAE